MSVNKVILIGNLGRDPEIKEFQNGKVAQVTMATTDRGYKKQDGTEVAAQTEWHNLVAWNGLATLFEKYTSKGSKVYVEGKIRNRSYDDKNGEKRYVSEIIVDSVELLSPNPNNSSNYSAPQESTPPPTKKSSKPTQQTYSPPADEEEDDLPF